VELEGQLSSPASRFKQLLVTWRALSRRSPVLAMSSPSRQKQRAEDRLGPKRVALLLADYQAGVPTTELMRTYSLGKGAVLRLLRTNGVPRRRQGLSTEQPSGRLVPGPRLIVTRPWACAAVRARPGI